MTCVGAGTRLDNLHEGQLAPGADYMTDIRIGVDTHELRLASAGEHRLEWTAGVYRRDASRHDRSRVWSGPVQEQWQDNHAWALFGELGYLLPGNLWSLTVGLRYFRNQVHGILLPEGNGVRINADFPALSQKLMVFWMPLVETLVYVSVSSGFRSGQLQPVMSILVAGREGLELPVAFAQAPGDRLQLTGSIVDTAYGEAIGGTPIERGDPVYNVPRNSLGVAWDRHVPPASGHALDLYARMRNDGARKVSLPGARRSIRSCRWIPAWNSRRVTAGASR